MEGYTTGTLAKLAGVNLETVRYYERRRLLPRPPRTASGYRLYQESAVRRLRFIRRSQALGFSLGEIKELLALRTDSDVTCADVAARVAAKVSDIERKLDALKAMKRALTRLVGSCPGGRPSGECVFLAGLDTEAIPS
jgi:DNA-binding transcriptional MerR regulator